MGSLLDRRFRANPLYELVLFDRLSPEERERLEELRRDAGFYGVLLPRETPGLGIKSVDRETALLFLTLRQPGLLPSYVREVLGEAAERTVTSLVADGVLEVESDGAFVSGAAALAGRSGETEGAGGGRLSELSLAALRYAQTLAEEEPLRLSWRLYGYNRRPLTPRWKKLLPSAASVEEHLGIAPGGRNRRLLDRHWRRLPPFEGWLSWGGRSGKARPAGNGATYKLYLSPMPEAVAEIFGEIVTALASARAAQFKVGAGAEGLLRPDKIVAYFPSFERLAEAVDHVLRVVEGVPAQGVPFTSEIGADGLLSWGVDPPRAERSRSQGESWRFWLTHRLARALVSARGSRADGIEPWRFALERLRLEGIDTATWTPGALVWREG
jgi:hypothetical protein